MSPQSITMFCETKSDVHNELVSNTMRRSRFTEIHKYLHLSDNFNLPPNDEFGKVRRYFEILNDNFGQQFEKVWSSHKSIHETMVPYYGRHSDNQHIHIHAFWI